MHDSIIITVHNNKTRIDDSYNSDCFAAHDDQGVWWASFGYPEHSVLDLNNVC